MFRDEKGFTVLEFLAVLPFVIWFLLTIGTIGMYMMASGVAAGAARDAARTMAVLHNQSLAVQNATADVDHMLNVNWKAGSGGSGNPHCAFDPTNPNPSQPDVVISDDGQFVTVTVTYHVVTMSPCLPTIFNSNLPPLASYIPAVGTATFKDEGP